MHGPLLSGGTEGLGKQWWPGHVVLSTLGRARHQPQPSRKGDGVEEGLPAIRAARSSGEKKQAGVGKLNKG